MCCSVILKLQLYYCKYYSTLCETMILIVTMALPQFKQMITMHARNEKAQAVISKYFLPSFSNPGDHQAHEGEYESHKSSSAHTNAAYLDLDSNNDIKINGQ